MTLAALVLGLSPAFAQESTEPDDPSPEAGATETPEPSPPAAERPDTPIIVPSAEPAEEELTALTGRIRALEEQLDVLQAADSVAADELPIDLETRVRLFADVNMKAFNVNHPPGFEIGDLVLSYSGNLNRKIFATADVIYGRNQFDDPTVFIDRIKVDIRVDDRFVISVGKMESPFGYWNPQIPYGAFRYVTVSRPTMLTFERFGAFITTRQTGINISGTFSPGFWQVGYHAGIGNGRSAQLSSTQDIGDATNFKALWTQVWIQSPSGIQLGMTVGYDPIRQNRPTLDFNQDQGDQSNELPRSDNLSTNPFLTSNVDEVQLHPHLAITGARASFITEGAILFHRSRFQKDGDDPGSSSVGGYSLLSVNVGRSTTPYVRGDYVRWWREDPLFLDLRKNKTRAQATIGVRQEIGLSAAVKVEGTYIDETVYRHPDDPLFIADDDNLFEEGINDIDRDRLGLALQLAVGF